MARKRILYVHHRPELGGAPVSLAGLIAELDRDRFDPYVYCPPGPASELFASAGATVVNGPVATFTHVWASYYSGLRWLLLGRELSRLPAAARRFSRLLDETRFDLVHLNDSPLLYFGALAKRAAIPVVWHLRSSLARGGNDSRSRLISRFIDATGAAILAIDSDVARSYVGSRQITIVHNSVDLERFSPQPPGPSKRRLRIPDDSVAIGLFGYLYAKKGWPDFLRAAKHVLRKGHRARFIIVGGGVRPPSFFETRQGRVLQATKLATDEERDARELVARLRIAEMVHFLPFSSDPRDAYWALDVVAFPNRGEGLGRAVIEASACGRPMVASGSLDGAGLVKPDETGFLVPRRSPDALGAVFERLVLDADLRRRLGENARRHAETNFDAARNAARVSEIYDEVLGAR